MGGSGPSTCSWRKSWTDGQLWLQDNGRQIGDPDFGSCTALEKRAGGRTAVMLSWSITVVTNSKDIQCNSVKFSKVKLPVSALGNDASRAQGDHDRLHATVYNLRKKMKISTWNVGSLYQKGKLENAKFEMARRHIDTFSMCEIKWTGAESFKADGYIKYY